MKNKKEKNELKSVRSTARKAIQLKLVKELKALAGQFGPDIKNIDQVLEKAAKKLAKKVAREFTLTNTGANGNDRASADAKTIQVRSEEKASVKASSMPAKVKLKPAQTKK